MGHDQGERVTCVNQLLGLGFSFMLFFCGAHGVTLVGLNVANHKLIWTV